MPKHLRSRPFFIFLYFVLLSCNNKLDKIAATYTDTTITSKVKTTIGSITTDTLSSENQYDTFFVVIADTGYNYYTLRDNMLQQSIASNLTIDTLERTFDVKKQKIVLPENNIDELYAGDYYPRRFPSTTLSIEPLSMYDSMATEKAFATVAGIFDTKNSADSLLNLHHKIFPKSYVHKSPMFIGCLH